MQMAQTALEKLNKKEIQFFPDSQEKIFREWLGNIQDWISVAPSTGFYTAVPEPLHCGDFAETTGSEILGSIIALLL